MEEERSKQFGRKSVEENERDKATKHKMKM